MIDSCPGEIILMAPIYNDTRFVEFRVRKKQSTASDSVKSNTYWSLIRSVVDHVDDENKHLISDTPVGAPYQSKVPFHLRNVTVIDSRPPGSSRATNDMSDPYFDLLSPSLRELEIGHVYVATDSSTSIADNARSFSASGTVVLLGGDTSVYEFVNALAPVKSPGHEMRLVVIPTGTGNALAISSGLPTPIEAVRQLFLSKAQDFVPLSTLPVRFLDGIQTSSIDTPPDKTSNILEHRAVVVVSWGFHSALVADSDSFEMRAKFRNNPNEKFKEAARINLETILQRYIGETLVRDELHQSFKHIFGPEHSYLLFTSVTYLEAHFSISPHSHPPSDNSMHMVAIKPFDTLNEQRDGLTQIMSEVYDHGKHIYNPKVTYKKLQNTVHIKVDACQSEQMRRWCIDGKIVVANPGTVEIGRPTHIFNGWELRLLHG